MKPTREQVLQFVENLNEYNETIRWFEDAIGTLCPSSYKPIINFYSPLSIVWIFFPEIKEELEYYIYECDEPMEVEIEGKEFKVWNWEPLTLKRLLDAQDLLSY